MGLKSGYRQGQDAAALGPTWPSLPGESQSHQTLYQFNTGLARNTAAAAARRVNVAGARSAIIGGDTGVAPSEVNCTVTGHASLRIMLGGGVGAYVARCQHDRRSGRQPTARRARYDRGSGVTDNPLQ